MKTGVAVLPLHHGSAPPWLFRRMVRLGGAVLQVMAEEHGVEEILRRISDPFWFQSLGCLLGFDWHSSGVTTTLTAALKEGIRDRQGELGLFIAGGKGATSRKTPQELLEIGDRYSIRRNPEELVRISRMTAKVDNNAVQDGFQLYHHAFFVTREGSWAVVQQGMRETSARRYHWYSNRLASFVREPHSAICSDWRGATLNLVADKSAEIQGTITSLSHERPEKLIRELFLLKEMRLPARHSIAVEDLHPHSIEKILLNTYEARAPDFESLLGMPGVGAKTLRALTLLAELVHGAEASWDDPAKFSFAHGGKDGHPYHVNRESYDRSIAVLTELTARTKIERTEKEGALKRLARFAGSLKDFDAKGLESRPF